MPLNCPLRNEVTPSGRTPYSNADSCYSFCDLCRQGNCAWFSPPEPLRNILTIEEWQQMVEARLTNIEKEVEWRYPRGILAKLHYNLRNTHGMLIHFQKQFNEHITPDKRKKLTSQRKGTGAVDV